MGKWAQSHPLKKVWSKKEIEFLTKNWEAMTNRQLADGLGLTLTIVRMKLYEMGYKRMEMEYWTEPMVEFLIKNFRTIGDVEMTEIFQEKFPKQKPWTKKHIEKKRRYLKLDRTKKELEAIQQRNVDNGRFLICAIKRWETTGQAKEKEVRYWREQSGRFTPRIKIGGAFIHWGRWKWQQHRGQVPKGMNVVFKDNDPRNLTLRNLIILSDADLARRNVAKASHGLSDNYIAGMMSFNNPALKQQIKETPGLIELKRTQLLINRKIKENGKQ